MWIREDLIFWLVLVVISLLDFLMHAAYAHAAFSL